MTISPSLIGIRESPKDDCWTFVRDDFLIERFRAIGRVDATPDFSYGVSCFKLTLIFAGEAAVVADFHGGDVRRYQWRQQPAAALHDGRERWQLSRILHSLTLAIDLVPHIYLICFSPLHMFFLEILQTSLLLQLSRDLQITTTDHRVSPQTSFAPHSDNAGPRILQP